MMSTRSGSFKSFIFVYLEVSKKWSYTIFSGKTKKGYGRLSASLKGVERGWTDNRCTRFINIAFKVVTLEILATNVTGQEITDIASLR